MTTMSERQQTGVLGPGIEIVTFACSEEVVGLKAYILRIDTVLLPKPGVIPSVLGSLGHLIET